MYHYDPVAALEELTEEAIVPNPVHVRDMILRSALSPDEALALNRKFLAYQDAFANLQRMGKDLLVDLSGKARKP